MKYLYIFDETESNAALFGVGTYIKSLILALKDTDMEITIFKLISNKKEVFIESLDNIKYIHIPKPMGKFGKKNYYRNVFYVIYPYIKKTNDVIFHLNYIGCYNLAKALKEHLQGKIVLTIHYRELHTSENTKREKDLIDRYCDKVIVLAKHSCLSLMKDYHIKSDKIEIIPNGIIDDLNDGFIEHRNKLRDIVGVKKNELVILYVGRLDTNKNLPILINAFQKLTVEYENINLFIVGSGNYNMAFKAITCSWKRIIFTGFLNRQELYNIYKIADIGVIPSIHEEFGYVTIEMMMYQIPVIANNTSGLAEIIENGKSGLLISLNNSKTEKDAIDMLANAIRKLINNRDLREKIGKNGRTCFKKKYDMDIFSENMHTLYDKILSK